MVEFQQGQGPAQEDDQQGYAVLLLFIDLCPLDDDLNPKVQQHSDSSNDALSDLQSVDPCEDVDSICFVYAQTGDIQQVERA